MSNQESSATTTGVRPVAEEQSSTALSVPQAGKALGGLSVSSLERLAGHAYQSGMFKRFPNPSAALMVMAMANELGLSPVIGLNSIHFIEGKPSMSGNLMWSLVMREPRYRGTRVLERTAKACRIRWIRDGEELGVSAWTEEDARRAGLLSKQGGMYQKYPAQMLFNRCVSDGFKTYAPELGMGYTLYTPDELGADINEAGEGVFSDVQEASFTLKTPATRLREAQAVLGWDDARTAQELGLGGPEELLAGQGPTEDELRRLEQLAKARASLQQG